MIFRFHGKKEKHRKNVFCKIFWNHCQKWCFKQKHSICTHYALYLHTLGTIFALTRHIISTTGTQRSNQILSNLQRIFNTLQMTIPDFSGPWKCPNCVLKAPLTSWLACGQDSEYRKSVGFASPCWLLNDFSSLNEALILFKSLNIPENSWSMDFQCAYLCVQILCFWVVRSRLS